MVAAAQERTVVARPRSVKRKSSAGWLWFVDVSWVVHTLSTVTTIENAPTSELRKARGAFFTPAEICAYISAWAIRSPHDRVLEPSCGEAAFVVAAGEQLRQLGGRPDRNAQVHGVDLHTASVQRARRIAKSAGVKVTLRTTDFFDYRTKDRFDAVIGNPPYVRYQGFNGEARAKAREAAIAHGVRLTNLSSSWAAFVVHASTFLTPNGRLGLVLPAELLTVNYASEVRSFLLRRFAHVRLVLFEERVFPGVTEEVVLLLAEGTGGTDHFEVFQTRNLEDLETELAGATHWAPSFSGEKWISALLPGEASASYVALSTDRACIVPLIEWGDPTLGMVTGNNKFFTLTAEDAERFELDSDELLRISPPGSRHLRGIAFDAADWRRMRAQGKPVYLFRPDPETLSPSAERYIARGRRTKVHAAFKCRVRKPWWRVPLVAVPDLFFTYMSSDAPRLVANGARVRYLNSIHGLVLRPERRALGAELLPLAMLNSLSLCGAELVGRSYGGGILKLEPKEADVLPVPSPELLAAAANDLRRLIPVAGALLREGELGDVVRLVDEALLVGHAQVDVSTIRRLEDARRMLHRRRVSRMGG